MKRGHPPESILCLHDWRGAGERTLVTPAPARHDTEILHFLCESKFGQVICTSVVPLHCFGKAGGNPGVGTRLSWETPAFLPLWAGDVEYLCPNLDTAEGSQCQSPWLRLCHAQGVHILNATPSGEEGEKYSLFSRFGNVAIILILICPRVAFMPFFLLCPSQSPYWKKNLLCLHSQNRLKSHNLWEPDVNDSKAVFLLC